MNDFIYLETKSKSSIRNIRTVYHLVDGSRIVVEVKPESLIDDPKNRAKIEAGRAFCSKSGFGYVLMSEQDLGMAA